MGKNVSWTAGSFYRGTFGVSDACFSIKSRGGGDIFSPIIEFIELFPSAIDWLIKVAD